MFKSWCEGITAIVILIVTLWPEIIGSTASYWVTIVAAVALLIHSFGCHKCFGGAAMSKSKRR